MDPISILKDWGVPLARFAQNQLMVWLAVVRNPRGVISKINLRSTQAVVPALRFVVFVYAVTLLVAFPRMFLYQHVAVSNGVVLLTDFVATALGFCMVGIAFYAAGKLLGGRGQLLGSMIAGLYLTALWPFAQVTDYFLSPNLPGLGKAGTQVLRAVLLGIVVVFLIVLIVAKASPVMRHVHGFGRVRATIAVFIQILLIFLCFLLFISPILEKLTGGS